MPDRIKRKMLVIEDCASDVFLLQRMLDESSRGKEQVEIVSVPRLIDAFQCIDEEIFDVILLDLNLLDIDGVASVAAIAAEVPGVPIIVYSGMESSKIRDAALMCGASDYLIKGHENGRSLQTAIDHATQWQKKASPDAGIYAA